MTTLEYAHATDPNLLTTVTDPFGRFATLGYDAAGRLNSITDAAGMVASTSEEISLLKRVMEFAGLRGKDLGGRPIMEDKVMRNEFGEIIDATKWAAHRGGTEIHYWVDKLTQIAYGFKVK